MTPAPSVPSGLGLGFGGSLAWQLVCDMPSAGCGCGGGCGCGTSLAAAGAGQRLPEEARPVSSSACSPTDGATASGEMRISRISRISHGSSTSSPLRCCCDATRPRCARGGPRARARRPRSSGADISGMEVSGAETPAGSHEKDEKYTASTRVAKKCASKISLEPAGSRLTRRPSQGQAPLAPRGPRELFSESLDTTFTTLSPLTPHTHTVCTTYIVLRYRTLHTRLSYFSC